MKTFEYPFFAKFIYSYANIPITMLLLIYFILSVQSIPHDKIYILTALFHAFFIIVMNWYYIKRYKYFPNKIQIDKDNLICSDFIWKNRTVTIPFSNISELSGGVFDGKIWKPMYIFDKSQNVKIGFTDKMRNVKDLATTILVKIRKDKYDELMKNLLEKSGEAKDKRKKRLRK
ncbi:MAG TPA: hypothetical protein VHO28_03220 [Ignavibacteriales bacterium]|nr:hypothetical protein [Ignavibacteriales bacterium]